MALTANERKALMFIQGYLIEHGYPPTVREVAAALSLRSTGSTVELLAGLKRRGFISYTPWKSRTLRLTRELVWLP